MTEETVILWIILQLGKDSTSTPSLDYTICRILRIKAQLSNAKGGTGRGCVERVLSTTDVPATTVL